MAHADIQLDDQDRYFAGDAIDIPISFSDSHDGTAIDLTGMEVAFRLKEDLTDDDANAYLTKRSDATDDNGNPEIEITDATNGECVVHILSDETADAIVDDTVRLSSTMLMWHIRVTNTDGARVTSETGSWEMHAS